jgi:putative SOS response-associated peptidase YedK
MCYNVVTATRKMIVYAKHRGDSEDRILALEKRLEEFSKKVRKHYYVSGFAHPILFGFTQQDKFVPQAFQWGLIPEWAKDQDAGNKLSKSNLNARIETITEKASFKNVIQKNRCLIYLDAFYEYHHLNGKTFPFMIEMADDTPMVLAGIYTKSNFSKVDFTCSFITTKANSSLKIIHNNPKMYNDARIPVILSKEQQDIWLDETLPLANILEKFSAPIPNDALKFSSVAQLQGKNGTGNTPKAQENVYYMELEQMMLELHKTV